MSDPMPDSPRPRLPLSARLIVLATGLSACRALRVRAVMRRHVRELLFADRPWLPLAIAAALAVNVALVAALPPVAR